DGYMLPDRSVMRLATDGPRITRPRIARIDTSARISPYSVMPWPRACTCRIASHTPASDYPTPDGPLRQRLRWAYAAGHHPPDEPATGAPPPRPAGPPGLLGADPPGRTPAPDRKSTRLNSSH